MPDSDPTPSVNTSVFFLSNDPDAIRGLRDLLGDRGIEVREFGSQGALTAANLPPPSLLVVDMRLVTRDGPPDKLASRLLPGAEPLPKLVCVGGRDNIEDRLWAMRAGSRGYFPAPVSVRRLAEKALQLIGPEGARRNRILIVEDDLTQGRYLSLMLANAGMERLLVADPLQVLDAIRQFRPDLILMDLYMPGASGSELAALIRDQEEHFDTPIVMLSVEEDPERQLAALQSGADSFLAKTVDRRTLIGTIEHRIRRHRWLTEHRIAPDARPTTAELQPKEALLHRIAEATRDQGTGTTGLGLLMVKLDEAKPTVHRLGIAGTERLVRELESRIRVCLENQDAMTRLGDFTYALLVRREDRSAVEALAERLRAAIADIRFATGDKPIRPTVSIGIGVFDPPASDGVAVVSRARKAALDARRAGGNRVQLWEPPAPAKPAPEADAAMCALIERAIGDNGLTLLFQPIFSPTQDWDTIVEVQLRLPGPDGEHILPADFLPVARRNGLIPAIDRWVLSRSLDLMDAARLQNPELRLLIHQTMETATASDWLSWFRDQVTDRNLVRQRPLIEIQLEDLRENADLAPVLLANLRRLGVQVCVANCSGTQEEADLLASLGVGLAKLSFRTLTDSSEQDLGKIVKRLRASHIGVVAAGIEDPATIARIWNCQPDYVQGHFLQMPGPDLGLEPDGDERTASKEAPAK